VAQAEVAQCTGYCRPTILEPHFLLSWGHTPYQRPDDMVGSARMANVLSPARRSSLLLLLLLTRECRGAGPVCESTAAQPSATGHCLLQKVSSANKVSSLTPGHAIKEADNATTNVSSIALAEGEAASDVRLSCRSRHLAIASGGVALVSELSFAALGFGPAIMYEICWQVFYIFGVGSGQLEEAVWNSLIMSSAVAVVQALWLRKHLNIRVALVMTLPLVAGLPVGTLVLEWYGRQAWVKRLLGAFFLSMVGIQNAGVKWEKPRIEDLSLQTCACVFVAAFVGGFSRGLFGVSAPVSLLLLFFSLDRDLWRLINAIFRIVIFGIQGSMLATHLKPQQECALMYSTLVVGGMVGMVLGNSASPYLSASDMQRWLSCFLVAAGLLMIGDGYPQVELAATVFSFLALLGMLAVALLPKSAEDEQEVKARKAAMVAGYGRS